MANPLIKTVVQATGLPEEPIQNELLNLIERYGKSAEDLNLDDLREVMAAYLQEVLLAAKDDLSA